MDDVAQAAGVSRGTVSRALNGGRNVSGDARAAIDRAVRKTGYVVNPHARSLATQRAMSVAFVLAEPQDRLFEDPNFHLLLHGCTQALADNDVTVLLTLAGSPEARKRVSRFVTAGHADGVLLVSTHGRDPLVDELLAQDVPIVACGRPLGHERDVSYVAADDRDGARQMVTYLRGRGYRRIGMIAGPQDTPGGIDRLAGYRDVLGEVPSSLVVSSDYTQASGEAALLRLLEQEPEVDAVFVASDLMAASAPAAGSPTTLPWLDSTTRG